MFLASLDPGVTTGVILAHALPRVDTVKIQIHQAQDLTDIHHLPALLVEKKCRNIFMEAKPTRPSEPGTTTWDWLYQCLLQSHQYQPVRGMPRIEELPITTRHLFLVMSSHWKTFMRSRNPLLPAGIPHHAKDAVKMLHYAVQLNYPNKEIYYAN